MIRGVAAAASDPAAAEAARATLAAGAGAIDAVIGGFFAHAGADPAVLLAPAVALVAGAGVGARAFDGRAVQPGRGAKRPRGFVDDAGVPDAARVAVPRSIAMLVLLHGYRGHAKLRDLTRAGVAAAEAAGAPARGRLLQKVGTMGALVLRAPEVERALLLAGGSVAGGNLTSEDLAESLPDNTEAALETIGDATVITSPWPACSSAAHDPLAQAAIVAVDGRGVVAALAYAPARGGLALPDLQLTVGKGAIPVRRGVTRLPPGTALEAPAPIAVITRGAIVVALAVTSRLDLPSGDLAEIARGLSIDAAFADMRARPGMGSVFGVLGDGRSARSLAAGAAG